MTVGQWLKKAREDLGLSYETAAIRLHQLPESVWASSDTIRRMEQKSDPDPVRVAALAKVYGRRPPRDVERQVQELRDVLDALVGGGDKPPDKNSPISAYEKLTVDLAA